MRVNNKKKFLIFGLIFVAVFMALGYSLLSATLSISTVNRVTGNWDVHINPAATVITTAGRGESQSFRISNDGLSASFTADLFEEGDSVTYQLSVVNAGNIPARLDDIQITPANESDFIKMSTTAVKNTVINANSSYTLSVTLYVDNPNELTLVDSIGTKYTIDLIYVQNT